MEKGDSASLNETQTVNLIARPLSFSLHLLPPVYFSSSHIKMKGPTIVPDLYIHPSSCLLEVARRRFCYLWCEEVVSEEVDDDGGRLKEVRPLLPPLLSPPHRPEGQNPPYLRTQTQPEVFPLYAIKSELVIENRR